MPRATSQPVRRTNRVLVVMIVFVLGVGVGTWLVAPWLNQSATQTSVVGSPTAIIVGESPPQTSTPTTLPVATATQTVGSTDTPMPPSPSIAPTATGVTPTASIQTDEILRLVNAERKNVDCAEVVREPRLQQAAQLHAQDMAQRGVVDHVGSDGATYQQRLDRVGYQYQRRGENIAAGFAQPSEVVAAWMDEPVDGPHRANISNCVYKDVGVGLAFRDDGYPYWVLDLAEPKP